MEHVVHVLVVVAGMRNAIRKRNRLVHDSHALHGLEHTIGANKRTALVGIGAQHHEFVTAHSEQQIGFAQQFFAGVHHCAQKQVARLVAVTIVNLF